MKKVIVIDDERIQRQGLVMMTPWQELGCTLAGEAKDAQEALRLMEKVRPDIAIVDIKMPGMNGLELIEAAEARAARGAAYILLSGYGEFSYAQKAIALGVSSYLLKPVSDEELMEAIKKAAFEVDERKSMEKLALAAHRGGRDGALFENFGMGAGKSQYLAQAAQIMEARCQENLTIRDVADAIGLSGSYLHRLFAKYAEYSFGEYLTLCRMRRAASDLGDGRLRIYEIAEHCGYKDTRYFSTVFRRVVGVTPTEYREGVRGKEGGL